MPSDQVLVFRAVHYVYYVNYVYYVIRFASKDLDIQSFTAVRVVIVFSY